MDRRIFRPGDLVLVQKGMIGMVMGPADPVEYPASHMIVWFGSDTARPAYNNNVRVWRKRYVDWCDTMHM